ncbi:MAG TPA: hypothetical protein EYN66_00265 [Myxococcales bacterium]|nr:hypothetical protein [Myxococcales bacterium]
MKRYRWMDVTYLCLVIVGVCSAATSHAKPPAVEPDRLVLQSGHSHIVNSLAYSPSGDVRLS